MRLALLVAFVGFLVFAPATVDARPGKATAASKQKAKKKAKPVKKAIKKKVVEEEAPMIEEETKPVAKQEARSRASVAQATDDEVPRNEPGKRSR
jgi:hypothetical protein